MNCEGAREGIILAAYGELPDDLAVSLERHLSGCAECLAELAAIRELDSLMAENPVLEPNPNMVAQSRMRLDEALDSIPQHGFITRMRASLGAWFGHLQSAPALATLLVGMGFLGGNFTYRYQVAHAPKVAPAVILSNTTGGGISTISGITQLPNDMVQVSYNRVVPEMAQGSLNDPQIRQLLMVATKASDTPVVRLDSVALLAAQCRTGRDCVAEADGSGMRGALLVSLRSDKNPSARLKALDGLQPYVAQDDKVRDGVMRVLRTDSSSAVRARAIEILRPVQSDSSVRQVLRTVSTTDENPYLRTVSTQALAGTSSLQ